MGVQFYVAANDSALSILPSYSNVIELLRKGLFLYENWFIALYGNDLLRCLAGRLFLSRA